MLATQELQPAAPRQRRIRPACPNCGRSMHLTRTTARSGGLSDLQTFACGECAVWTTRAADDDAI
jgi:predicted RNA-binding Zn-ribbon protein involved in translation (DUF1610 family)